MLTLRESVLSKLLGLVFVCVLLGGFLFLARTRAFPTPIVIFSGGGLLFMLLVQATLTFRTLRRDNWLLKVFPEGLALRLRGYLSADTDLDVFIPTAAIHHVELVREKHTVAAAHQQQRSVQSGWTTSLRLTVDKSKVVRKEKPSPPPKRVKMKFLFFPVLERGDTFLVELRSVRSTLMPSPAKLAAILHRLGLAVHEVTEHVDFATLDDDAFNDAVFGLWQRGDRVRAVAALRYRHQNTMAAAAEQLDEIVVRRSKKL